jgi:hypothetical protein
VDETVWFNAIPGLWKTPQKTTFTTEAQRSGFRRQMDAGRRAGVAEMLQPDPSGDLPAKPKVRTYAIRLTYLE